MPAHTLVCVANEICAKARINFKDPELTDTCIVRSRVLFHLFFIFFSPPHLMYYSRDSIGRVREISSLPLHSDTRRGPFRRRGALGASLIVFTARLVDFFHRPRGSRRQVVLLASSKPPPPPRHSSSGPALISFCEVLRSRIFHPQPHPHLLGGASFMLH